MSNEKGRREDRIPGRHAALLRHGNSHRRRGSSGSILGVRLKDGGRHGSRDNDGRGGVGVWGVEVKHADADSSNGDNAGDGKAQAQRIRGRLVWVVWVGVHARGRVYEEKLARPVG